LPLPWVWNFENFEILVSAHNRDRHSVTRPVRIRTASNLWLHLRDLHQTAAPAGGARAPADQGEPAAQGSVSGGHDHREGRRGLRRHRGRGRRARGALRADLATSCVACGLTSRIGSHLSASGSASPCFPGGARGGDPVWPEQTPLAENTSRIS